MGIKNNHTILKGAAKMYNFTEKVNSYAAQYKKIKDDKDFAAKTLMNENAYALEDNDVLAMPRLEGESRYIYLRNGLNFCAYSSGYISANEGMFSTFLNKAEGDEPRAAFFAGIPAEGAEGSEGAGKYDIVSLLEVPIVKSNPKLKVERYSVITSSCIYHITELENIRFTVRMFASFEKEIFFSVLAQNLTKTPVDFFISSYMNPFLRHNIFEDVENRFYRDSRYCDPTAEQDGIGSFLFTVNEHMSRTFMLTNYCVLNRNLAMGANSKLNSTQFTTSRYGYMGNRDGSLHNPVPLYSGSVGENRKFCSVTQVSIAADLLNVTLAAGENMNVEMRISNTTVNETRDALTKDILSGEKIDKTLEDIIKLDAEKNKNISIEFGPTKSGGIRNNIFNTFMEHIKRQVQVCSLHSGYMQVWENALIGVRDSFQSLEALLYYQPEAARGRIIQGLSFIDSSGRCPRQYMFPINDSTPPRMDLRPFIDQGVWIITTMVAYLKFTGDFSILDEVCGYYDIADEDAKLVKKSGIEDTVLDHIMRIMSYLENNRDHADTKCLRILYGDWNDALDGLGVTTDPGKRFGTGVSVMATLQYYQNLLAMIDLLEVLDKDKYKETIENYISYSKEIVAGVFANALEENEGGTKRVVHGWGDHKAYYVGSSKDPDGEDRVGLTANSFWIISKMYDNDPGLKADLMRTFKRLDSKFGMMTFDKAFGIEAPGIGRIRFLAPGVYENGAPYAHSTCFGIWALLRIGECEFAWDQIEKILPFTHEKINKSPFIMPNSYCLNEELNLDGDSVLDWNTGSSNTILKTLIRYIFGIQPEYKGFYVAPAKALPFESFDFKIRIGNCDAEISYKQDTGVAARTFTVNGANVETEVDAISGIDKIWLDRSVFDTDKVLIEIKD